MENLGGISNPSFDLRLDGSRPDPAQLLLRINTILQGEVLQLLDGGTVVLGVGGHRVPADTQVELKLGQKFFFQVQQGEEGKVVLKILPQPPPESASGEPNSFQLFQQAASKDAPLGETLGKLAQALLALVGEISVSEDPNAAAPTRLPGKTPLDAATVAFLRETASALQEELRAEWPAAPASSTPSASASAASLPKNPLSNVLLESPIPAPANPSPAAPPLVVLPETLEPKLPSPPARPAPSAPELPVVLKKAAPPPQAPIVVTVASGEPAATPAPSPAVASPLQPPLPPSPPAVPYGALRELVALLQRPDLRESIGALVRHLENGSVGDSPRPEAIRQHVEESGIPVESQLRRLVEGESRENPETLGRRDLKTLLLRVEGKLGEALRRLGDNADPELRKALGDFGARVRDSRESVEAKQLQNALRQDSGEALHFQIPYQDMGRLKTADFYYDRRQEGDKKRPGAERTVHHLVFLLDMSKLGKLRVDALLRGSRIQIAVNTADENAAAFVRPRLHDLQGALEGLGFEVGLLECRSGLAHVASENRAEFDLPVLGERHLVDLEG